MSKIGLILVVLIIIIVGFLSGCNEQNKNETELNYYCFVDWVHSYGGNDVENSGSVIQNTEGKYIIIGSTWSYGVGEEDIYLIKIDENGNKEWQKTYGGIENDYGKSVIQSGDGGYCILSNTQSYGSGKSDAWIIKTDENGNIQWDTTYGGEDNDYGKMIIKTSDDGYCILGNTWSIDKEYNSNVWLIKIYKNGDIQWEKTYGGMNDDQGSYVLEIDEGYIIVGYTESFGAGKNDVYILKIDKNGNILQEEYYGKENSDMGEWIVQTPAGGYIIAGHTMSYSEENWDVWLIKIDENLNKQWQKTFGGTDDDTASSIIKLDSNRYVISARKEVLVFVEKNNFKSRYSKLWLFEIDINGSILLEKDLDVVGSNSDDHIILTNDGEYVISSDTDYRTEDKGNLLLIKISTDPEDSITNLIGGWKRRTNEFETIYFGKNGECTHHLYNDIINEGEGEYLGWKQVANTIIYDFYENNYDYSNWEHYLVPVNFKFTNNYKTLIITTENNNIYHYDKI